MDKRVGGYIKSEIKNSVARQLAILLTALVIVPLSACSALAGPPFLTDDPDPVPFHHWEFYTFTTGDRTRSTNSFESPAIEMNNGVAPNVQLHLIIPDAQFKLPDISDSGLGDTEVGVKYRFVTETPSRPEIGMFPMAELPTGNAAENLGNGRTWYRLPIWLQKSCDRWTFDTGGGEALNSAPGQRNYAYGGFLSQYSLNNTLSLGGEVFLQGPQEYADALTSAQPGFETPGTRYSSIWNVGGTYNFTPDFSLLFSAGHSFEGDGNAVFYLSLYRTWGPGSP
jgi:hypothetical protein